MQQSVASKDVQLQFFAIFRESQAFQASATVI